MGLGCLWSWLIKAVLLRENRDKPHYHAQVEKARKAFEIVGEPGEVEAMCQESYDSQPELNLYWNLHTWFAEPVSFPDDQNIQQPEQGVEDK